MLEGQRVLLYAWKGTELALVMMAERKTGEEGEGGDARGSKSRDWLSLPRLGL